jgi:hypothetical protein
MDGGANWDDSLVRAPGALFIARQDSSEDTFWSHNPGRVALIHG